MKGNNGAIRKVAVFPPPSLRIFLNLYYYYYYYYYYKSDDNNSIHTYNTLYIFLLTFFSPHPALLFFPFSIQTLKVVLKYFPSSVPFTREEGVAG